MTTQTSSALPPPSTPPPKFEVFLSFRGLDTRKFFTDYLFNTLIENGIHTFRDDEQLDSGKPISTALLKAIEESQISVVILSKNYATSTWCLDELATMVELAANTKSRLILPVFYDVTPSEVREQTGEHFKEAFAQHDKDFKGEPGKVTRWKESLTAIANLSGFDLRGYRYAKEVIKEIVERIFAELNNTILTFSNDLKDFVGMDRVNKIKADMSSCIGSEEVRVVGICGMRGIGKTTIAKALSQGIRNQFEAFSFISKVGEISRKESLFHIQEQLCDHLLNKKVTTKNADDVICKRLCGKRVLIILDNVDELEQIEAVAGNDDAELSNRFGKGSRIIITTTDDSLLKNYKPMICRIDKLTQQEALLLFCRKAFKKDHPRDGYEKLSYKFVDYIDGLPLALEVLGSSLRDRSVEYWSSKLASLKDNNYSSEKKIIDVLKASFDGLENQEQKEMFLDTACFFKGENVCRVKKIFESCGYNPGININILCEKYLVSIIGGKLWMHDLLQQMGREIVRGESKKEGERSRLWLHTDALPVLKKNKGTDAVQGIFLSSPQQKKVDLKKDPFSIMDSLRLLKIYNVNFSGCLEYLSDELSFLEWHKYPLKSLPSSFEPDKLVELNLSQSEIELLWEEIERPLEKLVILNLSDCEKLIKTPDFDKLPNLEQLILKGCISLSEVPDSINLRCLTNFILSGCSKLEKLPNIGEDMKQLRELHLDGTAIEELPTSIKHLNGLTLLNLRDCKNLLSLPDIICTSLTALQILNLLGCSNLNELPENLGSLECLQELNASGTAIRELPTSIKHLTGLTLFNLKDCTNLLLLPDVLCTSLASLQILNLSGCSNLNELPENLGSLDFLQELDASGTAISQVPESISELSQLGELFLDDCSKLQSLPRLPFSIRAVSAHNCPLLQSNKITVWPSAAAGFSYINCHGDKDKAHAIWLPDQHLMLPFYQIFFERTIRHGDSLELGYRSNNVPEWLSRHSIESTITILLPPDLDGKRKWMGLALCFVCVAAQKHDNLEDEPHVDEEFGVEFNRNHRIELCTTEDPHECPLVINYRDCDLAGPFIHWCYIPRRCFAESSNTRLISASIKPDSPGVKVTTCGTSLIYLADVPEFVRKLNKHHEYCYHGHQIKQETTTPTRIVGQLRRNVVSLLGKLFEGLQRGLPHLYDYGFIFPLRKRLQWFSEQSSAPECEVNLPLPPYLHNDDNWAGLSLYFVCTLPPGVSRIRTFYECHLYAPIEGVGYQLMHRLMLCSPLDDNAGSHRLLIIHIPRVRFAERLNRCHFIHALFRAPGVEMCGMRLVYNQDLQGLIQTISHCTTRQSAYYGTGDFTDTKKYKGISLGATSLLTNLLEAANSSQHSSVSEVCPPFMPMDFRPETYSAEDSQHGSKTVSVSRDETEQEEDGVGSILSASGVRTEQEELQEQENTTSTGIVDELRRNQVSFLEKLFKGVILSGERFEYGYRSNEIPAWLSRQSTESTITIPLPPDLDGKSKWIRLALCFVCEAVRKHDSLEDVPEFDEELAANFTRNHIIELYTTEDPHERPQVINYGDCDLAGPFIHWCFIPRSGLPETSNKRLIRASITPDSPGTRVTGCGVSLICLEDVPKFIQKLNKHYNHRYQGYQHEQEEDGMRSIPWTSGVQTEQEELQEQENTTSTGIVDELRRNQVSFLEKLFKGVILSGERFEYGYRSNEIPAWLSRQSTESTITIPLPPDLDGKSKWIRLALCFVCEAVRKHDSLEDVPEFDEELAANFTRNHIIELYTTEDPHERPQVINYGDCDLAGPFIHWCFIPRSGLPETSNKRLIRASITPDSPGTRVTGCGVSLICLEDVPKFIQKLNKHYNHRYQGYQHEQEEDGMRSIPWTSGVQTEQEELQEQENTTSTGIVDELRRNQVSFLEKLFKGVILSGERFEYGYRSNEIPAWLSRQSTESTITIPLPPDLDGKSKWIRLALCFVCEAVRKHDSLEDVPEFDEELAANFTHNHIIELYTTEDPHERPQVINYGDCDLAGPFIHWCFIPRSGLPETSNKRLIRASITPDSPGTRVTGCGVSLICLEDVPKFIQKLNKHYNHRYQGYQHEQEEDGMRSIPWTSGVQTEQEEVQEQEYTTSTGIVDQLRINLVSLLEKLFKGLQRGLPHIYDYGFIFCVRERLQWFSEQSGLPGCTVNLSLPPNLHNDENWAGLSLYVVYTLPSDVALSRIVYECHLCTPIEAVGPEQMINRLELRSHWDDNVGSHRLLIIHVPRVRFPERLNRCHFVQALFGCKTPGVEVEMCGMRLVYNQDFKGLIETISHCTTAADRPVYYGTGDFPYNKKYNESVGATSLLSNLVGDAKSTLHSPVKEVCPPFPPLDVQSEIHSVEEHRSRMLLYADKMTKKLWSW